MEEQEWKGTHCRVLSPCLYDLARQTHLEVDGRCGSTLKTFVYEANSGLRTRGQTFSSSPDKGHEISHPRKPEVAMCTAQDLICKEVANVKPLYGLEVDVARILGVCAFSGKTVLPS